MKSQESQGIFDFTEVQFRHRTTKLPMLSPQESNRLPPHRQQTTVSQPTLSTRGLRTHTSWGDFAKREFHPGNLSPPSTAIPSVSASIDRINRELEEYLSLREFASRNLSPTDVLRSIRKIETSKQFKHDIDDLKTSLMTSQKHLNRLKHQRMTKEKTLTDLQSRLEHLQSSLYDDPYSADTVKQRELELQETVEGLENELNYQDTLEYMLQCRKLNLLAAHKPLNTLKRELARLTSTLNSLKMHNRRAKTAYNSLQISLLDHEKALQSVKKSNSQAILSDLEQLKNRKRLAMLLDKEQQHCTEVIKKKYNARRLKSLEATMERLQEEEVIATEVKHIETHVANEEKKFKRIQSVTKISSIADMEPYWRYLMENKSHLEKGVEVAQMQIEKLGEERTAAERELRTLVLETEERKRLNPREVEETEERLKQRMKVLEEGDVQLKSMQELLASATNCISRLAFQLADKPEAISSLLTNLPETLHFCALQLEQMRAVSRKLPLLLSDTLSTDLHSSPDYLNINFEAYSKSDTEDHLPSENEELDYLKKDRQHAKETAKERKISQDPPKRTLTLNRRPVHR